MPVHLAPFTMIRRARLALWMALFMLAIALAPPIHAQEGTPDAPEEPDLAYGL
ncbi:MAG: hypothetical protein IH587_15180, partial [Anaerolineae bacterium]|nr:hypothetical protein [Anaerolineae bacterium]